MDLLTQVPAWLLRPLPLNAAADSEVHQRLDELAANLPGTLTQIGYELTRIRPFREYDVAVNRACALVWNSLNCFWNGDPKDRENLLAFAQAHMPPTAQARIYRRLVKDSSHTVRAKAHEIVSRAAIHEVALPAKTDGAWDPTGWLRGTERRTLNRHKQGSRIQEANGVPPLSNLAAVRKLLAIRSPAQLGWFLLASDAEGGPYTRFTIPKRGGAERVICAPKTQLRWVQRRIHDHILSKVRTHDAAHGFIIGRSTVTNAAQHKGAVLLLKFDLVDFFPTIHYHRILGLFARLGYTIGNGRFGTDDKSKQVAPVLARLCCYTPTPYDWTNCTMPQGAPTSPALSNLICRRLDARLTGLAKRNKGVYTRYADDLTFSFRKEIEVGRFRWWVDQICHQEGFFINQAKFRVIRASQRQLVTGIVVNDTLHVPREERRRFRAILHNCRTKGIESQSDYDSRFGDYLRGFASYIHMIDPEEGTELLQQVSDLLGPETEEAS